MAFNSLSRKQEKKEKQELKEEEQEGEFDIDKFIQKKTQFSFSNEKNRASTIKSL